MTDLTHKDQKTGEVYRLTHSEIEAIRGLSVTMARAIDQQARTNRLIVLASIILPVTMLSIVLIVLWHVDQLDWVARSVSALERMAANL